MLLFFHENVVGHILVLKFFLLVGSVYLYCISSSDAPYLTQGAHNVLSISKVNIPYRASTFSKVKS